jgi:predicted secreted protein
MCQTIDGGYALAGATMSFGAGIMDGWLVKTDAAGNMQWNQTYGGTGADWSFFVVQTSEGGYALAGNTGPIGAFDFWLVKADDAGNMQWNKTYGGKGNDIAYSLVATSDGGYAIGGNTNSFGAGGLDFWLVKTDDAGNMQWNKTYGGKGDDTEMNLIRTADGGYAITGYTSSFGAGGEDVWLVKTDADGNMQWNQTYGGTGAEQGWSLIRTIDGGYAMAGYTYSFGAGSRDFWVVKTDELGVVPEYSSWLIPALVLTATAFIIINKKRLLRTH